MIRNPVDERRDKATELRRQGYTYRQIAEVLRITPEQAHADVTDYLRQVTTQLAESEDVVRQIEAARLDALQTVAQTRAEEGDLKAVEIALKIQARRAELLGLDAPKKIDIEHHYEALPATERIRLLEQALAEERALVAHVETEVVNGKAE